MTTESMWVSHMSLTPFQTGARARIFLDPVHCIVLSCPHYSTLVHAVSPFHRQEGSLMSCKVNQNLSTQVSVWCKLSEVSEPICQYPTFACTLSKRQQKDNILSDNSRFCHTFVEPCWYWTCPPTTSALFRRTPSTTALNYPKFT